MPNIEPFEVIGAPFTVWTAPVGSTFPVINVVPTTPWAKLGTSGDLNYMEDGVTVSHAQSLELWRSLGSPGPRKAFRSEEEFRVSFMLADLTLEQYANVLNGNAVADTPAGVGTPGIKSIGLSRGVLVNQVALVIRGAGPYGATFDMQFEIPRAVNAGEPEPVFRRDEPAALAVEFTALEDLVTSTPAERFGRIVAMTAEPT